MAHTWATRQSPRPPIIWSWLPAIKLVLTGGLMPGGGSLSASSAERVAGRLGGVARKTTVIGYAAYGLAFALSSLARALPSSSAPKIDGLSKRGKHSQSMDPSRETNAAARQSPISP
jgi:hypothetical protein